MQSHSLPQSNSIRTARITVNRVGPMAVSIRLTNDQGVFESIVKPSIARAIAMIIEMESQP
jgi:hypothetical protein